MTLWQRTRNLIARGLTRLTNLVSGKLPSARAIDESAQWDFLLSGGGPADRPWPELREDLLDALEAWRRNFLIRQIVRLTTAYVVGDGISLSSKRRPVEKFLVAFWGHQENKLSKRLPKWCDETTRSGEIFIALSAPNRLDGLCYVREVPASCISYIETDPDDYEREIGYLEQIPGQIEPKKWKSKHTAGPDEPMLLHYKINSVIGAVRGESDLTPILPWAQRYTDWLKSRVRFSKLRANMAAIEIEIDDDSKVQAKREQYKANPPTGGSIYVRGKGERMTMQAANLQGWDASPDGRAQRLAIAAGANIPLHFLSEGDSATRATAVEMGDPTHRHYRMRQQDFVGFLVDICEVAYGRKVELGKARMPADGDLKIEASVPDISRSDNQALARALHTVVIAFGKMRSFGWITDEIAVKLAFQFAGEVLSEEEIEAILDWSDDDFDDDDEPDNEGDDDRDAPDSDDDD